MTANTSAMWGQFVAEFLQNGKLSPAFNAVFEEGVDRVGLVREALTKPGGNNRAAAIALLHEMNTAEQQQLFPELVQLARAAHGPVAAVRKIIASLPREWVLARIDAELDRILNEQQYDDYWMFIELLAELDRERAVKLARRAAAADDPDIRELGSDMLATLNRG